MINKPANPFQFWCKTNQKYKHFSFEHGDKPFYVRLAAKGHIAMSVLIFADDKEHVEKILRDLISFRIKVEPLVDNNDLVSGDYTLSIDQIDLYQAFKVSWADNAGY